MSQHAARVERNNGYVDVTARSGIVTARILRPALGQAEAPIVAADVIEAIDGLGSRLRGLVLDCSAVTYMNSAGLGMCIDLRNRAHALGVNVTAAGLNDEMSKLFTLMKIDRLFDLKG